MNRNAYWSAVAAVAAVSLFVDVLGIGDAAGRAYCAVRHPVEAFTTNRTACERQHILQRQGGGGHSVNTIWINTVEHDYADRSGANPPWEVSERGMWGDWGDDNLKRAYKMGVYANGYHFLVYDYRGDGEVTLIEWDGASHFTYVVASAFNFITKEASYVGFQWRRGDGRAQHVDSILGVFVDFAEVAVGIGYGAIGIVVGTLLNPVDTLFNFAGMLVYSVESVAVGLWNTLVDILSLLTLDGRKCRRPTGDARDWLTRGRGGFPMEKRTRLDRLPLRLLLGLPDALRLWRLRRMFKSIVKPPPAGPSQETLAAAGAERLRFREAAALCAGAPITPLLFGSPKIKAWEDRLLEAGNYDASTVLTADEWSHRVWLWVFKSRSPGQGPGAVEPNALRERDGRHSSLPSSGGRGAASRIGMAERAGSHLRSRQQGDRPCHNAADWAGVRRGMPAAKGVFLELGPQAPPARRCVRC